MTSSAQPFPMAGGARGRAGRSVDAAILTALVLLYVIATTATDAFFASDAWDYVESVVAHLSGGSTRGFWDAGHLIWRPLGAVGYRVLQAVAPWYVGDDLRSGVRATLDGIAWLSGCASIVFMWQWLRSLALPRPAAAVAVIAFTWAQGFLDFAQAGASYVPGLAMLLAALWALAAAARAATASRATLLATIGGVVLAAAVLFWLLYAPALPAALLSPVLLFGADRRQWRNVLVATAACAVAGFGAYVAVAVHLGVADFAGFKGWLISSGHGLIPASGLPRVVFGFPRSMINMGADGPLVKRFMLHDPFNPVTSVDLVRVSLWKLVLFYAAAGATALTLLRAAEHRRIAWFAVVGTFPPLLFAVFWYGADVERYLSLMPAFYLAVGAALVAAWSARARRRTIDRAAAALILAFVAAMIVTNAWALSAAKLAADQARVAARVSSIGTRLSSRSLVVVPNWQDEMVNFTRAFPQHPLNRSGRLRVYALVSPGGVEVPVWRYLFAWQALDAWQSGGDVWVSARALRHRPAADWNWVEGDDPRVSWRDFPGFFVRRQYGAHVGGADGFVELARTPGNEALLRELRDSLPTDMTPSPRAALGPP